MDKAYSSFVCPDLLTRMKKIPHTYRLSISSTDKPVT